MGGSVGVPARALPGIGAGPSHDKVQGQFLLRLKGLIGRRLSHFAEPGFGNELACGQSGAEDAALQTLARRPCRPQRLRSVWTARGSPPLWSGRPLRQNTCLLPGSGSSGKAALKTPHSKRWRDALAAPKVRGASGLRAVHRRSGPGGCYGGTAACFQGAGSSEKRR
jgi:hypothetical protein